MDQSMYTTVLLLVAATIGSILAATLHLAVAPFTAYYWSVALQSKVNISL